MALFDNIRDEFTDRNVPLHLLLGLISLTRRLDASLGLQDSPRDRREPSPRDDAPCLRPDAESTGSPAGARPPRGDALLLLVLGLISFRRTLLCELEHLRASRRGADRRRDRGTPDLAPPARDLRDLLR